MTEFQSLKAVFIFNPLEAGGNKRSYIPKQTCSFQVQVCLSMYDLLLPPGDDDPCI